MADKTPPKVDPNPEINEKKNKLPQDIAPCPNKKQKTSNASTQSSSSVEFLGEVVANEGPTCNVQPKTVWSRLGRPPPIPCEEIMVDNLNLTQQRETLNDKYEKQADETLVCLNDLNTKITKLQKKTERVNEVLVELIKFTKNIDKKVDILMNQHNSNIKNPKNEDSNKTFQE